MGQPEPAPDQATTRKDLLDFLRRGARGHVKIFRNLAEQQVPDTPAHQECLEAGFLQFTDDVSGIRTKVLEPNSVLGLRNGEIIVNDDLRGLTG